MDVNGALEIAACIARLCQQHLHHNCEDSGQHLRIVIAQVSGVAVQTGEIADR